LLALETRFSENSAAFVGEQASSSVLALRFALSRPPAAIADSQKFPSYPDRFETFAATVRGLTAELGSTPQRWRRAIRIALTTAVGAGVAATLQIANPLGLTLLYNFAAPEMTIGLGSGVRFLLGAAALQSLGLALCGAMADSAAPHFAIFTVLSLVSSYLIYSNPRIGRLWIWVQIPVLTAFYLIIFDPEGIGWNDAQGFVGVAVAVAIVYLANTVLWPHPATEVLAESLANTLERSRLRLAFLFDVWTSGHELWPGEDRPVASKLGYHLTLLGAAARHDGGMEASGPLLAAVIVAERIHNEIDRVAVLVSAQATVAMSDQLRAGLTQVGVQLDAMLQWYLVKLDEREKQFESAGPRPAAALRSQLAQLKEDGGMTPVGRHAVLLERLEKLCDLLEIHPAELPIPASSSDGVQSSASEQPAVDDPDPHQLPDGSDGEDYLVTHPRKLNRFLVRYTTRHTIAMALAFVTGLFADNPALHAALWLLMIGGPPSHGGTVRKFVIRAIGAAAALGLAVLASLVVSPSATSLFPYMIAIFVGVLVMAYIGEGGGLLSYLSIGGTAFVIAFSGPGPRNDAFGSIWTIWGISFGMLIRAAVSIFWPERASRTLVEEFQAPLQSIFELVAAAHRRAQDARRVRIDEATLITGIRTMLGIANDAQLEGRSAGIDAENLVDALDSLRRVGFILGNRALRAREPIAPANAAAGEPAQSLDAILHARFGEWLDSLRRQDAEGAPSLAPLREMVTSCQAPELAGSFAATGEDERLLALVCELEEQLKTVSLH
jgi:hypothetical protein